MYPFISFSLYIMYLLLIESLKLIMCYLLKIKYLSLLF